MSIKRVIQQKEKTYYKHNFIDIVRNFIPDLYIDEDILQEGVHNDPVYDVLEGMLDMITSLSSNLYLSGTTDVTEYRKLFSVFSPYASLSPDVVMNVLRVAGKFKGIKYSEVSVAEQIAKFDLGSIKQAQSRVGLNSQKETLVDDVLVNFLLNNPSYTTLSSLSTSIVDTATAHTYMLNNYGWLYVLNNEQLYDSESKYITCQDVLIDTLAETTFKGKDFTISDGIKAFMKYLNGVENRE